MSVSSRPRPAWSWLLLATLLVGVTVTYVGRAPVYAEGETRLELQSLEAGKIADLVRQTLKPRGITVDVGVIPVANRRYVVVLSGELDDLKQADELKQTLEAAGIPRLAFVVRNFKPKKPEKPEVKTDTLHLELPFLEAARLKEVVDILNQIYGSDKTKVRASGLDVFVTGTDTQRADIKRILDYLTPDEPPSTEVFPLTRRLSDLGALVTALNAAFGPGSVQQAGNYLILKGTRSTIDELRARLDAASTRPAEKDGEQDPKPDYLDQRRVGLYYIRDSARLVTLLTESLAGMQPTGTIKAQEDGTILLVGPHEWVKEVHRLIAYLDLRRAGIGMEMWGVQVSSGNAGEMAKVLTAIQKDIDVSRDGVRATYAWLQQKCGGITESEFDASFVKLFVREEGLGYSGALSNNRPLSLVDILLRLAALSNEQTLATMANELEKWLGEQYPDYCEAVTGKAKDEKNKKPYEIDRTVPFRRTFRHFGLTYRNKTWEAGEGTKRHLKQSRVAILEFALAYKYVIGNPTGFDPYYLQQTSSQLDSVLQQAVTAVNEDMQELFLIPTLAKIQKTVRKFDDIDYGQAGKTTVATLSGVRATVSASSASYFDVTPPLRLSELLDTASTLEGKVKPFIPLVPKAPPTSKPAGGGMGSGGSGSGSGGSGGANGAAAMGTGQAGAGGAAPAAGSANAATEAAGGAVSDLVEAVVTGGIPVSRLIGLISAFGEYRAQWREMATGVSLDITPVVLRNAASAELNLDVKFGDPLVASEEKGVPPVSRVTKHEVNTRVYVDSMDLFSISTFNNQSTHNGGRGYVPIIGTIWEGIFGDIPVLGKLFSWKKGPKTRYHQSVILTNSIITPTAVGVGTLYPLTNDRGHDLDGARFASLKKEIAGYRDRE